MRRWLIRILIGLVGLIVLIAVAVQAVLWSSIPTNLVVGQIEQQMGLRIHTDRLTTGWMGHTSLSGVSLGLPLSKQSFLQVKTLKVKHTNLFGLIFGQGLSIDSIEIDDPVILVREDAAGQWNLQEVAELLARTGGEKPAQTAQQHGIPKLPNVKLVNGVIHVVDNQGHETTLAPLNVTGQSIGALVWNYDLTIDNSIHLIGKVAPGGSWRHELSLQAHHLTPMLQGLGVNPHHADVSATWQGQLIDGKLTGRLTLDHATAQALPMAGNVAIGGAVDVEAGGGAITLRPRQIELKTSNPTVPDVRLAAGTIVKDADGIQAQSMQVATLGGLAVLDARFDPRTSAADMNVRWSGLSLSNHISHSGTLTASLRMPFTGQPAIAVNLTSQGATASAHWDAQLKLSGQGQSWKSIDWVLTAPTLDWIGGHPIRLTQLTAHVTQRWPSIELTDMTMPTRPHLVSRGAINLSSDNWYFWLDAGQTTSTQQHLVPIAVSLNAWGNASLYTLHELDLQIADAYVWAGGFYDRQIPNPINLDLYLTKSPHAALTSPVQGQLSGSFHVSGLLFKEPDSRFHPQLGIAGNLQSHDLVVLDRRVGDVAVKLRGSVDNTHAKMETSEMLMFQGKWHLSAEYASPHPLEVKVDVHDLPVAQLAQLGHVNDISGQLASADWTFEIPSASLNRIEMQSHYVLQDLKATGVSVDQVTADATLKNGLLKIDPLVAKSGNGRLNGTVSFDLNSPSHVLTKMKVDHWPYGTPGGALLTLSADTSMDIDLKRRGATGPLTASMEALWGRTPLAHVDLASALRGRVLTMQKLSGNVLKGTFDGSAQMDLDKPLQASGQIRWSGVDAATFATIAPALDGLGGLYSGTLTIAPARDPRPPAPVRMDINVAVSGGHFRSIRIGGKGLVALHAVAYANTDRLVLDHSDLHIGNGLAHVWARIGQGQLVILDLQRVQLNQIAHLDKSMTKPMPGLIDGRFTFVGSGADLSKLGGTGHITLTQTDLGNFGPIAFLYNIMHVGQNSAAPNGNGAVDFALEQNTLRVTHFRYFNRGVEAAGLFNVGPSIWDIGHAPISGQVIGTARPLRGSRLSLLAEIDRISGAIQRNLTTVNIFGTVDHPGYVQASIAEIGGSLNELLGGEPPANGQ